MSLGYEKRMVISGGVDEQSSNGHAPSYPQPRLSYSATLDRQCSANVDAKTHRDLPPDLPNIAPSLRHLCVIEIEQTRAGRLDYPCKCQSVSVTAAVDAPSPYFTLSSRSSRSASNAARMALSCVRKWSVSFIHVPSRQRVETYLVSGPD